MTHVSLEMDMTRPCPDCPFSQSCQKGWLGRNRARDIAEAISTHQQTFQCHKTIDTPHPKHCAGAMIVLERMDRPNQWMRWMIRAGRYDPDQLDMGSNAFETLEDFINHHTREDQ